jgi:hypothetical protein
MEASEQEVAFKLPAAQFTVVVMVPARLKAPKSVIVARIEDFICTSLRYPRPKGPLGHHRL